MQTGPCEHKLIFDTALDGVGKTPLVRLDRIAKAHGLKCNLRELDPPILVGAALLKPAHLF